MESKPPFPPFDLDTARQKVRLAEDGWNTRDPKRVALAYSEDSRWRNRAEFVTGRAEIEKFLERKWTRELDYRLIKELWAFTGARIAVRFCLRMARRLQELVSKLRQRKLGVQRSGFDDASHACINDLPITESERKYHWPLGRRPDDHPGLSDLGF